MADTTLGLKKRQSAAPRTPAKEFMSSFRAWDSDSFLTSLASSRARQRVVTISGRQCFSRENAVPCGPFTTVAESLALEPSTKPTGSTRNVRIIDGYRLL